MPPPTWSLASIVRVNSFRSVVRTREARACSCSRALAWYEPRARPRLCPSVSGSVPKMLRHAVDRPATTCSDVDLDLALTEPPVNVIAGAEMLENW